MTLETRRPVTEKPYRRAKQTANFVGKHLRNEGMVLDIGDMNFVGSYSCDVLNLKLVNTFTDLDYEIEAFSSMRTGFEIVFCFEVIEHLMNPRIFFDNLHKITADNVQVFLSYPARPKLLWNNKDHFHEYDSLRFSYLLNKTGWQVVQHDRIRIMDTWTDYFKFFKGFRPLLRLFYDYTQIYEIKKL